MTHKEKAVELLGRYCEELGYTSLIIPVQCAIIAVDEIIEQWEYIHTYLGDGNGELNPNLKYWQEVKQELEKML